MSYRVKVQTCRWRNETCGALTVHPIRRVGCVSGCHVQPEGVNAQASQSQTQNMGAMVLPNVDQRQLEESPKGA